MNSCNAVGRPTGPGKVQHYYTYENEDISQQLTSLLHKEISSQPPSQLQEQFAKHLTAPSAMAAGNIFYQPLALLNKTFVGNFYAIEKVKKSILEENIESTTTAAPPAIGEREFESSS